jgi:hypothetical protein
VQINWTLLIQIASAVIAVVSAVVASINVERTWRYRPHWARDFDNPERDYSQRVYNRTREDAEGVQVTGMTTPPQVLRSETLVADGGFVEYTIPANFGHSIRIEWIRSRTRRHYYQDLIDPEHRSWKQRFSDARKAWTKNSVKGHRASGYTQG